MDRRAEKREIPRGESLELNKSVTSSHQALPENSGERLASHSPVDQAPWVLIPGEEAVPECHGDRGHVRDVGPHLHALRTQYWLHRWKEVWEQDPWAFLQGLLIALKTDIAEVCCF